MLLKIRLLLLFLKHINLMENYKKTNQPILRCVIFISQTKLNFLDPSSISENPKNGGKNNNQKIFIQVTNDNSLQIKLNKPSLPLLRLSQATVRTKMCTFFGCCLLKYNNFSAYLKIHKNQEKSVPFCLKCTILCFL